MNAPHLLVVGGGASGLVVAAQLLRRTAALRVTIVERSPNTGGIAYSTPDPRHTLNTRAGNMSAFADDPDDFRRWLEGRAGAPVDPQMFATRRIYGEYLAELVDPWRAGTGDGRLELIEGECVALDRLGGGFVCRLKDGRELDADGVVLATGPSEPRRDDSALEDPWQHADDDPSRPMLIVGTGLTMVDCVLSLGAGREAPIFALSRRGLLPMNHRANRPMPLDRADVPLGTGAAYTTRWLRRLCRRLEENGGDWRDAVDGLRPHAQALWQAASSDTRRRFLRHARGFWEVHRHRMPPESAVTIDEALSTGRLRLLRGAFLDASRNRDGTTTVRYRPRGTTDVATLVVGRAIDARGIVRDPARSPSLLVRSLLAHGLARLDPLRIGLDVATDGAVLGAEGPVPRLWAVGPVTRARFWEITAVPDIRLQAAALAPVISAALAQPDFPVRPSSHPVPTLNSQIGS